MKFVDFSDADKDAWNSLVERSEDGWLYQRVEYLEYALREGVKSLSFAMLTDTGELIAVCPLYLARDARYSDRGYIRFFQRGVSFLMRKSGLDGPWDYRILETGFSGPAFAPGLGRKGRRKALKEVARRVDELALIHGADEAQIRLTEVAAANAKGSRPRFNPWIELGFYEPLTIPPRLGIVLDLSLGLEELWSGMDEDCRSEARRASREGCSAELDCEDWVRRYHAVHEVSWNRTMGHSQALEHFSAMESSLGKAVRVFFARYEGADVAAVMLHVYKDAAFYWGGCSLLEGQRVKANNFLLFEAVKWAKERGYARFGIGVFDAFPGLSEKEYKVGRYKAQFASEVDAALECKKHYSRRALRFDSRSRMRLLRLRSGAER